MRVWPEKTVQEEFDDLGSLGFTGTYNDRQFAYLRDQGYTGALADMITAAQGGPSYSVSIGSGDVVTGTELTATVNGLEGGETVSYQWTDDGANISGATSSTYTPAIGTDSVAKNSLIRCVATVDGEPYTSGSRRIITARATGGTDLDLSFVAGTGGSQNLLANWTLNGNTMTLVSVSPALPANVTVDTAGELTAASGVVETADATYTLTMEDEYGFEVSDTFTLEITAVASGNLDDFNRSNEALEASADWTQVAADANISADVVSNRMRVTSSGGFQIARYTYDITPANDQYLEFIWRDTNVTGSFIFDFFVRLSVSGTQFTGYGVQYGRGGTPYMQIKRWTNDGETDLGASYAPGALADGAVIRLEAEGTTIRLLINGSEVRSVTDSNHTAGKSGFRIIMDSGIMELDDWETGDL